jgi:outer membrane protein assembly factor BamA
MEPPTHIFPSRTRRNRLLFILLLLFVYGGLRAQPETRIRIGEIRISGNAKTREQVILRELEFSAGDTMTAAAFGLKVYRSRLNLLNTALFNRATIDTSLRPDSDGIVNAGVTITVQERWYIWPVPVLQITDRNVNAWLKSGDFTRINYGLTVKWYNFTGRLDELDAVIQAGKNRQYSLSYRIPYLDRQKKWGLGFAVGYRKNREVGYLTASDRLSYAFESDGLTEEKFGSVMLSLRNGIYTTHELSLGYSHSAFSDTLLSLNPDYSFPEIKAPRYFYLYYRFKADHRDIRYYPLRGWYADLELNRSGLEFGSTGSVGITWAKSTARLYVPLGGRWYSGIMLSGKISSGEWQPYFLIRGLGYGRDFVRGYEYNVIDGRNYALMHSTVKFALIPEQHRTLNFIGSPKFSLIHYALYLTAFADAGYVGQTQWKRMYGNKLPEQLLAGAGLGADLVTYYDKVVRVEFAMNRDGKSGIFIHFIAGI